MYVRWIHGGNVDFLLDRLCDTVRALALQDIRFLHSGNHNMAQALPL
jgi:hypothetical protein